MSIRCGISDLIRPTTTHRELPKTPRPRHRPQRKPDIEIDGSGRSGHGNGRVEIPLLTYPRSQPLNPDTRRFAFAFDRHKLTGLRPCCATLPRHHDPADRAKPAGKR